MGCQLRWRERASSIRTERQTNKRTSFEYQNPQKQLLFPVPSTRLAITLRASTVHRHVTAPSVPKTECWGSYQRIPGLSILMPLNDATSAKKLRILIYSVLRALHNYICKCKETDWPVCVLHYYALRYRKRFGSPQPSPGRTKQKKNVHDNIRVHPPSNV
jgi:hypothetical protein